jgi:peptidoglycan/LPS O-acetylase OafA/YrhL
MSGSGYWLLVAVLTIFGALTGFTIGIPFLLLGIVLAVLAPYRHRRRVFWPPVIAVPAFVLGFVLVAPLGCTATGTAPGEPAARHTVCSNAIGIDYSGPGSYNPSLMPALLAGMATALVGAVVARLVLRQYR